MTVADQRIPESPRHDHVLRRQLPWRRIEGLTECGLPAGSYPTLTAEQMAAKLKREGQQRAAMSSCMTCWNATMRHRGFLGADDLIEIVAREIERCRWNRNAEASKQLRDELQALVMLAEARPIEFESYLCDLKEVVDLGKVRDEKRRGGAGG